MAKYRITQWLDTSDLMVEELPILYGIERNDGNGWKPLGKDGRIANYTTLEKASEACDYLRKRDMAEKRGDNVSTGGTR